MAELHELLLLLLQGTACTLHTPAVVMQGFGGCCVDTSGAACSPAHLIKRLTHAEALRHPGVAVHVLKRHLLLAADVQHLQTASSTTASSIVGK